MMTYRWHYMCFPICIATYDFFRCNTKDSKTSPYIPKLSNYYRERTDFLVDYFSFDNKLWWQVMKENGRERDKMNIKDHYSSIQAKVNRVFQSSVTHLCCLCHGIYHYSSFLCGRRILCLFSCKLFWRRKKWKTFLHTTIVGWIIWHEIKSNHHILYVYSRLLTNQNITDWAWRLLWNE